MRINAGAKFPATIVNKNIDISTEELEQAYDPNYIVFWHLKNATLALTENAALEIRKAFRLREYPDFAYASPDEIGRMDKIEWERYLETMAKFVASGDKIKRTREAVR